jgi:hypothetical protein
MQDVIGYKRLVRKALRDVIRQVLADVAVDGLPGEHCFRIKFPVDYPGVVCPSGPPLYENEKNEIIIAIEGMFWDLVVTQTEFSVTLPFHDRKTYRVTVPFNAITGFYDPVPDLRFDFDPDFSAPNGAADAPNGASNIVQFKKPA